MSSLPDSENHWTRAAARWESQTSADQMLRRARDGAVTPARVDFAHTLVTVGLNLGALTVGAKRVLTQPAPGDGFDTLGRWFVTQLAPGCGDRPLARLDLAWSYRGEPLGELAVVFDLCDHAEALDALTVGAALALTVDPVPARAGAVVLPRFDSDALSLALRSLAAHRLHPPAWRQRRRAHRPLTSDRWSRTHSMAAAERELLQLAGAGEGIGTVSDAVFDQHAVVAAVAGEAVFADAQPIVVAGEIVRVLPDWEEDRHAYQYGQHARLPLPAIYLDLAGKHGAPLRLGASERYEASGGAPPPWPLHGALCWQGDGGLHIIPFGADRKSGPVPEPRLLFQFTGRSGDAIGTGDSRILYTCDECLITRLPVELPAPIHEQSTRLLWHCCGAWITTILAVLYLLESANVSLRPATPHGKAAKRARATGQQPSLLIQITAPVALTPAASSPGAGSTLSYRHWRRGSYAHYGPRTAIGAAEPDKLTWVPERSGYYRKVWRRPTIVGPPDAPIRLKARRWRVGPDPTLPL